MKLYDFVVEMMDDVSHNIVVVDKRTGREIFEGVADDLLCNRAEMAKRSSVKGVYVKDNTLAIRVK
jgi:hypothetical protein